MGKGIIIYSIFLVFLIALTFLLALLKLIFKSKIFSYLIIVIWSSVLFLILLSSVLFYFTSKKEVEKEDIYGEYVIDREKYAGKQADWQYNHYRFKITDDNKIIFYITEKENIVKTIEGKVEFTDYSHSPHLKIELDEPEFHILKENPTLYREVWSFYYVFESEKYNNVFFTKGNWRPID